MEKEYPIHYPSYEYRYQCLLCGKEKYWPIDGNSYQIEMDSTEFRKVEVSICQDCIDKLSNIIREGNKE